jgi:hypothetical protein
MIEEYSDNKSYKHEETCTYDGKIWRASCYTGLNDQGKLIGISPKDGVDSFWIEDEIGEWFVKSLEDQADSAFNVG